MADADSLLAGTGGDAGGLGGGSGLGMSSVLGLGALGAGAGIMAFGSKPTLPAQYLQAQGMVPEMQARSGELYGKGTGLVTDAERLYAMAGRGELTEPQKANLEQFRRGITNQAKQTYASMGRDFATDTSSISTQQQIDTATIAQAQQFIQSTIALATSEMQGGQNLIGDSLGYSQAATNTLLEAGKAQIALDKQYSDQMAAMFGAIGKVAAAAIMV